MTNIRFILSNFVLKQATSFVWRENSPIRIVYASWMLAILVLTTSYSGSFYSRLTLPTRESPIDSVSDLVRLVSRDSHFIIIPGESGSYLSFFIHANPELESAYLIGQHINRLVTFVINNFC